MYLGIAPSPFATQSTGLFRPSTLTPGSGGMVSVGPSAATGPATTFQPATPPKKAGWLDNLLSFAPQMFMGYTQLSMQRQIAKINLERLRQGLPPLSPTQTETYVQRPGVSVGLSPATRNMVIIGGVGLGAILLLGMMGKKKRR